MRALATRAVRCRPTLLTLVVKVQRSSVYVFDEMRISHSAVIPTATSAA